MRKLDKLERMIYYVTAARMGQEIVMLTASLCEVIRGRSDWACYFLILSIWIGGQMAQFQNDLTIKYNRLLDEQERRDGL